MLRPSRSRSLDPVAAPRFLRPTPNPFAYGGGGGGGAFSGPPGSYLRAIAGDDITVVVAGGVAGVVASVIAALLRLLLSAHVCCGDYLDRNGDYRCGHLYCGRRLSVNGCCCDMYGSIAPRSCCPQLRAVAPVAAGNSGLLLRLLLAAMLVSLSRRSSCVR